MNLDQIFSNILIKEFEAIVVDCRNSEDNIDDFLYFYSAAFGVVRRVMNFQSEPALILAHLVLENSYQVMNQRWGQSTKPGTAFKSFPKILPKKITEELERLIKALKDNNGDKVRLSLESISNISYIATGNGNYLYHRGKITL
jgi:hypothetical protein